MSVATLLLLGTSFLLGVYVERNNTSEVDRVLSLVNKSDPMLTASETVIDFESFWKTWNIINEKFVSTASSTSDQEKVWGAIEGLVDSLGDPYSVFLPPADSETFAENISGNFGGVGMEIGIRNDILTVIAPLKNTPAERAGLLPGDNVIGIDDETTVGIRIDEAVRLIRGEIGTEVVLTIMREDVSEPFDVPVVRGIIAIPTIDTEAREDGIFVVSLYNFSATSPQLFREALREFVLSGTDKLIIDIRGNTGGFLNAAVDITSWFLPAGKVIVTEDFGGSQKDIVYRSKGYDIFNENLKLVVLVDRGSASASEIFAGALSEHGLAQLVGEKTFGKGSVQELMNITNGTSLKLTVANWLTPEGNSFSENGIVPDFTVEITDEDRDALRDPQLEKAIALLLTPDN
tara:strand:- start:323 stop:1534 length:1212 start_codon:yes stop_codon:yes gene_type:complete